MADGPRPYGAKLACFASARPCRKGLAQCLFIPAQERSLKGLGAALVSIFRVSTAVAHAGLYSQRCSFSLFERVRVDAGLCGFVMRRDRPQRRRTETPAGDKIKEKSLLLVVYGQVCACVRVCINHSINVSLDK